MSAFDHTNLRELFDLAMQRPANERPVFLDGACRGNAALRARVDELIKAAEADGTFLSAPTSDALAGGTTARERIALTAPLVEGPGTKIGLYKLLQLIGEGGFGSVFMAEQSKPVQRRVALKIIKLGMDTRQVIARFEQERQALAIMDHPNIARVLDAGATESGRPFFVMELVKGDSITKFCDAHRLDLKQRLELFLQVCRAVQHAHSKGVIHRDLKPSNIIVSMHDGRAFAKVIDFGIAKATASRLTEKTLFTEHHQLIGTPEYMSPEQAEGSLDIDIRTDVYSLGVLLYELLVGSTPFDAARLRSAAYAELQRIIKEEEPPAPSLRLTRDVGSVASAAAARNVDPSRLGTLIKGELDWIALRCLDKDRARRYETASALAQDIERHLNGDAVEAAPPTMRYRVRKFVKRNRGAVIAGSAVAAALLIGVAGTTWGLMRANAQRDLARHTLNEIVVLSDSSNARGDAWSAARQTTLPDGTKKWIGLARASKSEDIRSFEYEGDPTPDEISKGVKSVPGTFETDLAALRNVAVGAIESQNESVKRLQSQADEAKQALSKMFVASTEDGLGMRNGLPVFPKLRDDPEFELIGITKGTGTDADPFRFDFAKKEKAGSRQLDIEDAKLLPILADTAVETLKAALTITESAEWSAYTANIALAQASMQANNWPEARQRLEACPESKRGWEWKFLMRHASTIDFALTGRFSDVKLSDDGSQLLCLEVDQLSVVSVDSRARVQTRGCKAGSLLDTRWVDGSAVALVQGRFRSDIAGTLWIWSAADDALRQVLAAADQHTWQAWLSPRFCLTDHPEREFAGTGG